MASYRRRGSVFYYRYRNEHGKQIECKGSPDIKETEFLALEAEQKVRRIKAGILKPEDVREVRWREAEARPLTGHVEAWHAAQVALGRCPSYINTARDRVLRMLDLMKASRISHLNLDDAQRALAGLKNIPGRSGNACLSERTVHHHVRALKTFSRWLWVTKLAQEDHLAHLRAPQVVVARQRQAMSPEQLGKLFAHTDRAGWSYTLSGPDRARLYALAAGTGFRANELRSLTPESFHLDQSPPVVVCLAAYAKNRKQAEQPIRPDLARMLAPWLADKEPGRPVFRALSDTAKMIRRDLAGAGLPATFDFHSLRHTFITQVVLSGVSVKVAQTLARHSDPKLTLNVYSHVGLFDLARGLEGLALTLPSEGTENAHPGQDETSPPSFRPDPENPRKTG